MMGWWDGGAVLGMVTEGGDPSSSDVTFLQKSQGHVKKHSNFMQAVCTLLWTDCFETYMVVTYPLDLSYHEKKPGNFSFDNMGPLILNFCK